MNSEIDRIRECLGSLDLYKIREATQILDRVEDQLENQDKKIVELKIERKEFRKDIQLLRAAIKEIQDNCVQWQWCINKCVLALKLTDRKKI